jgi:uncharacterized protein YprB with RNaseH-like and TPR domain
MMRSTFIIFTGIGTERERKLWKMGCRDWNELPSRCISMGRRLDMEIADAETALKSMDAVYFARRLKPAERWRLLFEFESSCAFVDVEMDSYGKYANPSIVGICRNNSYAFLMKGRDLDSKNIAETLGDSKVIVFYNGARHDLHFLRRLLPDIGERYATVDLLPIASRLGIKGGLKKTERELGVRRSRIVELSVSGRAVELWKSWRRTGRRAFLNMLTLYNSEDACNLRPLAMKMRDMMLCKVLEET